MKRRKKKTTGKLTSKFKSSFGFKRERETRMAPQTKKTRNGNGEKDNREREIQLRASYILATRGREAS